MGECRASLLIMCLLSFIESRLSVICRTPGMFCPDLALYAVPLMHLTLACCAQPHTRCSSEAREARDKRLHCAGPAPQMATHPDKNQGVVGALEASQRVNAVGACARVACFFPPAVPPPVRSSAACSCCTAYAPAFVHDVPPLAALLYPQANDVLSDEVRRRQYDVRLVDEEQYGPRSARRGKGASPASFAGEGEALCLS